jgi:Fe(3+) dicitrate transport protein
MIKRTQNGLKKYLAMALLANLLGQGATAQGVELVETQLDEVVVRERIEKLPPLMDVTEGQIYSSKKITVTNLQDLPDAPSGEIRRQFSRTPGVYVSEIDNPSVVNLTIRGIGEPHESQDIMALQDGVPIQSTLFGYPTLYYIPASELTQKVEVYKGGSSLLYGPQPAGVVNFVTKMPEAGDLFKFSNTTLFGSHGMISTYAEASGAVDKGGYLASFYHRQADGFRDVNSDYSIFNGHVKMYYDVTEETRVTLDYNAYNSETGEAGRLSFAQWQADPTQVIPSRVNRRIFIRKHFGSVTVDHKISDETHLTTKLFTHYQQRKSRRGNNLDDRLFRAIGNDTRLTHEYDLYEGEVDSTLTAGYTVYYSNDPTRRNNIAGMPLATTGGVVNQHQSRETMYGAIFAENMFSYGNLRVIPSFRADFVALDLENNAGANVGVNSEQFDAEPLFGFGIEYDLTSDLANTAYFNFAQGYQPLQYAQILRRGAAAPNPDTNPGNTFTYELGVKGEPVSWLTYDASLFHVDYQDFIDVNEDGNDNLVFLNAGDVEFYGIDLAFDLNISNLADQVFDQFYEDRFGALGLFFAAEFLQSEIVSGTFSGNESSYAPEYSFKFGPTYRHPSGIKVDLTASYIADSYWNSRNATSFTAAGASVGTSKIQSYAVWDLAIEVPVYQENFKLLFGINNLFDEKYYSRVRADGIQPVAGRNFYGGFNASF